MNHTILLNLISSNWVWLNFSLRSMQSLMQWPLNYLKLLGFLSLHYAHLYIFLIHFIRIRPLCVFLMQISFWIACKLLPSSPESIWSSSFSHFGNSLRGRLYGFDALVYLSFLCEQIKYVDSVLSVFVISGYCGWA